MESHVLNLFSLIYVLETFFTDHFKGAQRQQGSSLPKVWSKLVSNVLFLKALHSFFDAFVLHSQAL